MKIIITSFALVYATSTACADSYSCSNLSYAYPDVSPVDYNGNRYNFYHAKDRYNTECVDSTGEQFEYGTIAGVSPSIATPGGGCSNLCLKGYGRAEARGCNQNQRPPTNHLVGFEYDCEQATCKCLYQVGTLGDQYSKCFDDMNTSNQGNVYSNQGKLEEVYTLPSEGQTCYALEFNKPPSPSPRTPVGTGICSYSPDFNCYQSGHPSCCSENNGKDCPNELTMCDNQAQGMTGWNYCTQAPNFKCWKNGQPKCCDENPLNCPKTKPECDNDDEAEAVQFVKYLRSSR